METLACVAATFAGERAFFPNPLSVSPLVRERILSLNIVRAENELCWRMLAITIEMIRKMSLEFS